MASPASTEESDTSDETERVPITVECVSVLVTVGQYNTLKADPEWNNLFQLARTSTSSNSIIRHELIVPEVVNLAIGNRPKYFERPVFFGVRHFCLTHQLQDFWSRLEPLYIPKNEGIFELENPNDLYVNVTR